ncbi:hypothetical protein [Mycobacterium haemophilum]|nr:hypothetical protein [Mycobacterium haemophilum]
MAGKDIDPIRVRSALDVIKQNPGIVAAVVLVLIGGAAIGVKR